MTLIRAVASSPMGFEAVLIDWAGTVTVPMRDMMLGAAKRAELDDDALMKVFGSFSDYVNGSDTIFHQAERGEIDDDDLIEHFNSITPGAGQIFDVQSPASFLHAEDRPEMIRLLEDLRDADVTVFLATNNFRSAQDLLATRYLDNGLVSAVVNSALVGTRKPEDAFFELCLEAAGCEGSDVVFLDDQQRNLDAGATFGITGILVGNDETDAVATARQQFGIA